MQLSFTRGGSEAGFRCGEARHGGKLFLPYGERRWEKRRCTEVIRVSS